MPIHTADHESYVSKSISSRAQIIRGFNNNNNTKIFLSYFYLIFGGNILMSGPLI